MKKKYIFLLIFLIAIVAFFLFPTPHRSINELYRGTAHATIAALDTFRTLPVKSVELEGKIWEYLVAGEGSESILFLHGMAGAYDIWWQQINFFKKDYKIISLTYPPVTSLKEMGIAITRILDNEHIDKTNVIGSSLGGYLAQYMVSNYPHRFEKAVFANTFPPNDRYKEINGKTAALAKYLPEWLIMYVFRASVRKNVLPAAENSPLAEAYLLEQSYGGMSKAQFLARYECVVDKFEPSYSLTQSKDIMIIESNNDPLILPELRRKMKDLYPRAKVFTFRNKGHFPYLNETHHYNKLMKDFFGGVGG